MHRCKRLRIGRLLPRLSTRYLRTAATRGSRMERIPAHQQDDRSQNGEDEECHPDGSESGGEVHDEGADGRSGPGGHDNGQIAQ